MRSGIMGLTFGGSRADHYRKAADPPRVLPNENHSQWPSLHCERDPVESICEGELGFYLARI
jgi:hypothetical protein